MFEDRILFITVICSSGKGWSKISAGEHVGSLYTAGHTCVSVSAAGVHSCAFHGAGCDDGTKSGHPASSTYFLLPE